MIEIYRSRNHLEVPSLKGMLTSHYICFRSSGTCLSGTVDEPPAYGISKLNTDLADADRARVPVNEWLDACPVIVEILSRE